MAAHYIALARVVPADWQGRMRPYREQVQVTMARYGGFHRTYLRHRMNDGPARPVGERWRGGRGAGPTPACGRALVDGARKDW